MSFVKSCRQDYSLIKGATYAACLRYQRAADYNLDKPDECVDEVYQDRPANCLSNSEDVDATDGFSIRFAVLADFASEACIGVNLQTSLTKHFAIRHLSRVLLYPPQKLFNLRMCP